MTFGYQVLGFGAFPNRAVSYGTPTLVDNLIHWWKFDGDGTDSVGSITLTPVNTGTFGAGFKGQAYTNAADADYIENSSSGPSIGAADASLAMWVKADAGVAGFVGFASSENYHNGGIPGYLDNWAIQFDENAEAFRFTSIDGSGGPAPYSIHTYGTLTSFDNDWHHYGVALNYTNPSTSTFALYFDGVESSAGHETASGRHMGDMSNGIQIGAFNNGGVHSGGGSLHGSIDDFRVYNVTLTEANFASIYNSGAGDV